MNDTEVLIVGAGPTGLVLALYLNKCGVKPRIIDKASGPGLHSRAMAVQARTLEYYRQLGLADEVVAGGIKMDRIHLREGHHDAAIFDIGDIGEGISPYPFALSYPQDDHERFLGGKLKEAGLEIEWNTELIDLEDDGESVRATLCKDGADETITTAYLCGCDGAHSVVRQQLHLDFPGGTYDQVFYVADVDAAGEGANQDLNACLGANILCLVFPIRSSGMYRLIGIVPEGQAHRTDLTFNDIRTDIEELIDIRVSKVNWFATYHVHHRVAQQFQVGRVFICGDAGHIHSPAGGQGMNTGIGDAVNLAWKLAGALRTHAKEDILNSYEIERMAYANSLVSTTDRAFRVAVGKSIGSQILRTVLVPHLGPFALGFTGVRKAAFRTLSQTRTHYHASPLSKGEAGDIQAGDRLPWVEWSEGDNFEPLKSFDWQVHVYGMATNDLMNYVDAARIPLHQLPWSDEAADAGLAENSLYLIRPDGYTGLVLETQDVGALKGYIDHLDIATRP